MFAFRYVVWTVVSLLSIQGCWGVEDNPSSKTGPLPTQLSVQGNLRIYITSMRNQYANYLPQIILPMLDNIDSVVPHLEYFHRPALLFWDPIGQFGKNCKVACPTPQCGARMEKNTRKGWSEHWFFFGQILTNPLKMGPTHRDILVTASP